MENDVRHLPQAGLYNWLLQIWQWRVLMVHIPVEANQHDICLTQNSEVWRYSEMEQTPKQ